MTQTTVLFCRNSLDGLPPDAALHKMIQVTKTRLPATQQNVTQCHLYDCLSVSGFALGVHNSMEVFAVDISSELLCGASAPASFSGCGVCIGLDHLSPVYQLHAQR